MDIAALWKKQTEKWNAEQKCSFCWNFGIPMQESQMNIQQLREGSRCCVQVLMTDVKFSQNNTFQNGQNFNNYCEWTHSLYFLLPSQMGVKNYNEIEGYPAEQSKWETIYQPLYDCIGCDEVMDFCETLGYHAAIVEWKGVPVYNYLDMNYDGWKLTITLREYH